MLQINKIYNMDVREGIKLLDDNSIDITITSPPYKEKDGYCPYFLNRIFRDLYRIHKDNTLFFLNFGHLSNQKFRPFDVLDIALCIGFKLNDTIVWLKNHYTPLGGHKHLNNLTEFIFLLYKGEMPNLDRLSIGIPYKDKSNVKRYNNGLDLKCGGNFWFIKIPTITNKSQRLHKDEFPLELPERCIKLSGLKNGLCLDPFSGSATTAVAAKSLGLNYIGFEKDKKNFEIGNERLL